MYFGQISASDPDMGKVIHEMRNPICQIFSFHSFKPRKKLQVVALYIKKKQNLRISVIQRKTNKHNLMEIIVDE